MPSEHGLDKTWPLGRPPRLGDPMPERMQALTLHRDQYGPPATAIKTETVPAPVISNRP